MNQQLKEWSTGFGNEYVDRNLYDPSARIEQFNSIIPKSAQYILEVGCNIGNNLETLDRIGCTAVGVEPNMKAVQIGLEKGRRILPGNAFFLPFADNSFDLVFTCGVLMHIEDYMAAMKEIHRVARKYILAIEYRGDGEEILYHGKHDMLWKRPGYNYNGHQLAHGQLGEEFDYAYYQLYKK